MSEQDDVAYMTRLGIDPGEFAPDDARTVDDTADGEEVLPAAPVLAVVGRPNVGKSTLVNRMLGRREAVVQDIPGVTRDRVAYDALWNGRRFTLVDTGGWEPDATGLQGAVAAQAALAMQHRGRRAARRRRERRRHRHRRGRRPGAAPQRPARAARRRRRSTTSGSRRTSPRCGAWAWGSRTRSAACTAAGPATCSTRSSTRCPRARATRSAPAAAARAGWRWSASRTSASPACSTGSPGRPARSCTTSPGRRSTRSTRWSSWTARCGGSSTPPGLRKRVNTASGMEYYASLRTRAAIEAAEVAVVLVDASRAARRAGPAGDHAWSRRPAGRWCWRSTSGTSSTRTGGWRSSASSSATSSACSGPSGSTSPR